MRAPSLLVFAALALTFSAPAQGSRVDYERADALGQRVRGKALMTELTPNWLAGNARFWFEHRTRDGVTFVVVDASDGTRAPLFDHARLAAALTDAGEKADAARLPLADVELTDEGGELRFIAFGHRWACALGDYAVKRGEAAEPRPRRFGGRAGRRRGGRGRRGVDADLPRPSPDGAWTAGIIDANLVLQSSRDARQFRLSHDGGTDIPYTAPTWAPDGKTLVAYRTTPGDVDDVYTIETSPDDQLEAKLHSRPYARPGDRFPSHEMHVFSILTKEGVKVDAEPIDFGGPPRLQWRSDGQTFVYEKRDRGHQRARIIEVDVATGTTRTLLDEQAATFLDHYHKHELRFFGDVDEFLWASERDGWNHLYLYDARAGTLKNQVTRGEWVMRGVDRVDEDARQIWFHASGMHAGRDPYLLHYFRVDFDGTHLTPLTEGDGTHTLQWSPDNRYYVDSYSRVDAPPVHELRRGEDGALITELARADVADVGIAMPEVFTAKGRDGTTDIWGIILRPTNFDPDRRYPVLENIYAGPHDSHVPKSYRPMHGSQAMAELGFIVVHIDGMGTNNRSKAFHDVCWHNLADAGFPDRIAWLRAAAADRPYMDLDRVGIYGTSAGGQNALGGQLFHGDFYKVGVSSCGCHDNRLDKASWNEQWMGYPVGPHYEAQSNITNAHKLQGPHLLIVGELDTNVPPESTYRVVDALIKADKDFDLLVIPGADHTSGGRYGERRRRDFFVRHLLGVEPRWEDDVAGK